MEWRRPDGLAFPTVWDRFEGKPHGGSPPLKYIIQEITEDMIEEAVEHMIRYFLVRENIMSSVATLEDKVSTKDCQYVYRNVLKQGVGLAALVEDDGDGRGNRKIAGINVTFILSKDDKQNSKEELMKLEGKGTKTIVRFIEYLEKNVDIFSLYGTNHYMSAYGLSVAPQYNGDGVGYHLLMARTPLCRALGISLTVTSFTSHLSQYLAKKAGFETIASLDYNTYKQDGKLVFPRLEGSIHLMAKRIPIKSD